jgi:hypothetical protein
MSKKNTIVAGVKMNINIEAIATALHKMHVDAGQEALISFGMLSAPIMEAAKKNLEEVTKQRIDTEISEAKNVLNLIDLVQEPEKLQREVNRFVNDCMKDITVYIYGLTKMVV